MATTKKAKAPAGDATKKAAAKAGAESSKPVSAALSHGEQAYGARFVKPGFARSPEHDLLFALGWPHMRFLVDGHPDDADPAAAVKSWWEKFSTLTWPREVAHRTVRAFGLWDEPAELKKALGKKGPVTAEEARKVIKEYLSDTYSGALLLLVEAMLGPELVADAAIATLEGYTDDFVKEWGKDATNGLRELGFVLLRLPEQAAGAGRARLEALYKRWTKVKEWEYPPELVAELDVVLHGAAGAERSAYRPDDKHISDMELTHVVDAPELVAKHVVGGGPPDESSEPDPRLVFLGGPIVLAHYIKHWKKFTKPGAHEMLVERFSPIAAAEVLPLLLDLSASSKAKKAAAAWFVAHAAAARPFLEKAAGGKGPEAGWAKAILGALPTS